MKFPNFNFSLKVGTKLGIISVLGIFLVSTMAITEIRGFSTVKSQTDEALSEQTLARDLVDAKASIRGMLIALGNLRVATSREDSGFFEISGCPADQHS